MIHDLESVKTVPTYYISEIDFGRILDKLITRAEVYAPKKEEERLFYSKVTPENKGQIVYNGPRAVLPIKSFFFAPRESVGEYFGDGQKADSSTSKVIIGVAACDVRALKGLDEVFLKGDIKDPFYVESREKNLVISTDCKSCWPSCFCTLIGFDPHPEDGFDLNLSKIHAGFLVEVGSKKGEALYQEFRFFFREATPEELSQKERDRNSAKRQVTDSNARFKFKNPLHRIVHDTLGFDAWRDITRDCVECGACNFSCPTCTCFLLFDKRKDVVSERIKIWDACLKAQYARVAGGANPRPKYFERLNNRYQCKFDYMHERHNMYTCVGCGRCIDGCMAKIDMREALTRLEADLALSAKLE